MHVDETYRPQSELVVERARDISHVKTVSIKTDSKRTVDQLSMVVDYALDRAFPLKVPNCNPRKATIDLEPLD